MSVYVGDKKATVFHGDQHPAEIWGPSEGIETTGKNLIPPTGTFNTFRQFDIPFAKGVYTISCSRIDSNDKSTKNSSIAFFGASDGGSNFYVNLRRDVRQVQTIELRCSFQKVFVYAAEDYTTSLDDISTWHSLQIELGSVATEYEPYTGGKPGIFRELVKYSGFDLVPKSGTDRLESVAPYNAAVQNVRVRGNVVQERLEGKNFIPGVKKGAYLARNGVFVELTNYFCTEKFPVPNTTKLVASNSEKSGVVNVLYWDANDVFIDSQSGTIFDQVPDGASTMALNFYKEGLIKMDWAQLEEGTTATPYEPYCGGIPAPNPGYQIMPVFWNGEVESKGRNLANINCISDGGEEDYFITQNNNGTITITTALKGGGVIARSEKGEIKLKELIPSASVGVSCVLSFDTESTEKYIYLLETGITWWSGTFITLTEQDLLSHVAFYGSGNSQPCIISNFQIEFGTLPTPYEPYFNGGTMQIPELRAIKDDAGNVVVQDEKKSDGTIIKRVKELVFDGTEDWRVSSIPSWRGFEIWGAVEKPENRPAFISNQIERFKRGEISATKINFWIGINNRIGYYVAKPTVTLPFYDDALSDKGLSNWKKHLSEHPLKIWYELSDPIIEHYDPQTLHQHPGYTQLIANANLPTAIDAEFYEESAT